MSDNMDNKIKESYDKVRMSRDARERIYTRIIDPEGDAGRCGTEDRGRGNQRGRSALFGWKAVIAACLGLALLIPTGVYAAGKISRYFTVTIDQNQYQAEIRLNKSDGTLEVSDLSEDKTPEEKGFDEKVSQEKTYGKDVSQKPKKYIQVKADFGEDYRYVDNSIDYYGDENGNVKAVKRKIKEGQDGMYSYSHKDGFDAGKDFYFDVLYMDAGKDTIWDLYDQELVKEMTVNGHKAFLCKSNTVHGSRYVSDYDTDYTINLFLFYEEYGYVINFGCMQGLGQEKLVSLAECISVTEAAKDHASRYEYLSRSSMAAQERSQEVNVKEEITVPVNGINYQVNYDGLLCQVTDVKVSSKVLDTDLKKFGNGFFTEKTGLWDEKGRLKPYIRENIKEGDGVSQPEASVAGTDQVQPRMVYVTMKVKARKKTTFQLPAVNFLEKEGEKYYRNGNELFWQYNRPEKIEDALVDFMPCYFKETAGGKSFWLKEMKKGEEQIYHFAYMVDGDLTDYMVLVFGEDNFGEGKQYVDLSK